MAFVNLNSATIQWGPSPNISLNFAYEKRRSTITDTSMEYRIRITVGKLTGNSYFGFKIRAKILLDNVLKANNIAIKENATQWANDIVYTSDWLAVDNKYSGTTSLKITMWSPDETVGDNGEPITHGEKTWSYSMPVDKYHWSVIKRFTNLTSTIPDTVEHGGILSGVISPANGYILPSKIYVRIGRIDVEPTYDSKTGVFSISNVNGAVTISADAIFIGAYICNENGVFEPYLCYVYENNEWVLYEANIM